MAKPTCALVSRLFQILAPEINYRTSRARSRASWLNARRSTRFARCGRPSPHSNGKVTLSAEGARGRMRHEPVTPVVCPAALCSALTACQKKPTTAEEPPPEEASRVAAPATPAPIAAAPTPAPAIPAPALAPEGVYFLTAATSVETAEGLVGLQTGTRVTRQTNGRFKAGEHELDLRPDQITNNLAVAGRLAGRDAAAQAAIRQTTASRGDPRAASAVASDSEPASRRCSRWPAHWSAKRLGGLRLRRGHAARRLGDAGQHCAGSPGIR